ncbi:MAG: VWA domain-containing protein [Candidatus Brocadiae bacterium]|nr:VWA domain-containing protein [Candidatus Brocadiia bacterium]
MRIFMLILFSVFFCSCGTQKESMIYKQLGASAVDASASPAPEETSIVREKPESKSIEDFSDEDFSDKGKKEIPITAAIPMAAPKPEVKTVAKSTLKAGSHNDNEEFVRYLEYLERPMLKDIRVPRLNVRERYILQVKDTSGNPVPNCQLRIFLSQKNIGEYTTSSSGEAILFVESDPGNQKIEIEGKYLGNSFSHSFIRGKEQVVPILVSSARQIPDPLPLDIVFLLDTTGSMGDEIQKLKDTLFSIHHRITSKIKIKTQVRFGMVLYRDSGDEYITKLYPLTSSLEEFQQKLDNVSAKGGGDVPEELDQALSETITEQNWNDSGLRLVFLVTDAPPHLNRHQERNYVWAMKEAAKKGIKVYSVGASGLDMAGEYVLRQIALFTQGQYIFLTYGEKGESSDSDKALVSHHTGANFKEMLLDDLIVSMVKKDLSYLVDVSLVMEEEIPEPAQYNAFSLNEKVSNLAQQLCHSASQRLKEKPSIAVFPLQIENSKRFKNVERFVQDAISQELKKQSCKLVEREEIKKAIAERMLSSGAVLDEKEIGQITQVQGAEVFLSGRLYAMGESMVLFAQLVDVKSLEKLAVARVLWTPE